MLARLMVGRDIVFGDYRKRPPGIDCAAGADAVSLKGVSGRDDRGVPALKDVDLDLYRRRDPRRRRASPATASAS